MDQQFENASTVSVTFRLKVAVVNKLSPETVKDIKMMLIYSGLSDSAIARYKAISQSQVTRIKLGDCYSQIDMD